jgi:hypothetical protein
MEGEGENLLEESTMERSGGQIDQLNLVQKCLENLWKDIGMTLENAGKMLE